MNRKIVFCNIAYMKYYDIELYEEKPKYGGKYVMETGDAFEKSNFHVNEDGNIYGFVETKYKDTYLGQKEPKQIRIENIDDNYKKENEINDVCVVFCAYSDQMKKTVIVGWYKRATVLRHRKNNKGKPYNIYCMGKEAFLLPEENRKFVVPRAHRSEFGFGQSNIWYAKENKSQEFVLEVKKYIDGQKLESQEFEKLPQQIPNNYYESGQAIRVSVNRYERNPNARKACLSSKGTKCNICGFDAKGTYGDEYEGKIEVHHIVPIHTINNSYVINPQKDLIPVCPNCHMILHTKKENGLFPSVEELKNIINAKK